MASETAAALISGVTGLIGGGIAALAAPWAKWGVEKRRRRDDARVELIKQWRTEIRQLRNAEVNHLARLEELKESGQPEEPDSSVLDPKNSEVLRRLCDELPSWALTRLNEQRTSPVTDRKGQIPDLLERQVLRIERKWGLPESPV